MRKSILLAWMAVAVGQPAVAQEADFQSAEIIVTAARREGDNFDERMPAVGLKRTADFAVQRIVITGDSRDSQSRVAEIYDTLLRAIQAASSHGVQLAYGDTVVEALSAANYRDVTLGRDSRPDTNLAELLVKVPLSAGIDAREAAARIAAFRKAVKPVGRALIEERGDLTLSIVGPDQYRPQVAARIAEDARVMAAAFGPSYMVEVKGLNRPVEWARAGLTEVLLYLPYELTVVPVGAPR